MKKVATEPSVDLHVWNRNWPHHHAWCGSNKMLSLSFKRHYPGSVTEAFRSARPMVFGLALTLATYVLVVMVARFNS